MSANFSCLYTTFLTQRLCALAKMLKKKEKLKKVLANTPERNTASGLRDLGVYIAYILSDIYNKFM